MSPYIFSACGLPNHMFQYVKQHFYYVKWLRVCSYHCVCMQYLCVCILLGLAMSRVLMELQSTTRVIKHCYCPWHTLIYVTNNPLLHLNVTLNFSLFSLSYFFTHIFLKCCSLPWNVNCTEMWNFQFSTFSCIMYYCVSLTKE